MHYADPFPKVTVTRRMDNDGSKYFGPYTSVWAVHQTLDVLRKIFPYLTCDRIITGADPRACLYFDIKLCMGPCIGAASREQYRAMIDDLCRFLRGHTEPIVDRMKTEMVAAAEALQFEKAAALRDQLVAIERVVEKQKVISSEQIDSDVIAFARSNGEACVQIFFIRAGKLIGRENFVGRHQDEKNNGMSGFIVLWRSRLYPARCCCRKIEEARIINEWLNTKRGGEKVTLTVPHRVAKRGLVEMAAENASETLAGLKAQWEADTSKHVQALAELQTALALAAPPNRIECFDISHIQGAETVASMVFEQAPRKAHYRRFSIVMDGPNDFLDERSADAPFPPLDAGTGRADGGGGIAATQPKPSTQVPPPAPAAPPGQND